MPKKPMIKNPSEMSEAELVSEATRLNYEMDVIARRRDALQRELTHIKREQGIKSYPVGNPKQGIYSLKNI